LLNSPSSSINKNMAKAKELKKNDEAVPLGVNIPIWELGISELDGKSLEKSTRDEVNKMLADGWLLLHIYTLKYREDNVWRERPMAILGKPKSVQ
jgi:hypothetical protein